MIVSQCEQSAVYKSYNVVGNNPDNVGLLDFFVAIYRVKSVSPGLLQYAINRFHHPSVRPVGQTLLTGPSTHAKNAMHYTYLDTHNPYYY